MTPQTTQALLPVIPAKAGIQGHSLTVNMIANRLKGIAIGNLLKFTGSQKFLSVQLDITNACNLSCAHCYHVNHSNKDALDFSDWLKILDQYGHLAGKLCLKPTGGIMKEQMRRCILLLLTLMPIASVAFAAKSALSIAQIGMHGVSDDKLANSGYESKG